MTPTSKNAGRLSAILATLRPRQWVKNLFVVAPLVFAKHLFDWTYAARSLAGLAVFCALSGAVYAFNDARDAPQDRLHPLKRYRPVASGALSENTALVIAGVLAVVALAGAVALSVAFAAVAAGYLANNAAYTLVLKRWPFVDVMSIAGGFLMRVVAGALVLDVDVSPWLLVCTGLLALMLGFGKRAHELALIDGLAPVEGVAGSPRQSLAGYRRGQLTWVMILLAVATCGAYAFYTRDSRTVSYFGTGHLVWTLPFPVAGILRFLDLAVWRPRAESPTDAILRDWMTLVIGAAWTGAVLFIIYDA